MWVWRLRTVRDWNKYTSSNWLSLRLDEDPWQSIDAQEEALRLKLSDSERLAWEEYKNAEIELEISAKN